MSNFLRMSGEIARALIDLYAGMLEAGTNGIGYSPKVADAMKRLTQNHPVELKLFKTKEG